MIKHFFPRGVGCEAKTIHLYFKPPPLVPKFTLHTIAFIGILITFSTCRDKDPTKPGYQSKPPIPVYYKFKLGEAKAYLWSKPGSYWIYKNTDNNELDTQICTSFAYDSIIKKGTRDYSKHKTVEYDRIRRTIQSSYKKWVYYDETSDYSVNYNTSELKTIIDRYRFNGGGGLNAPFFHPFVLGIGSGTGGSYTHYIGMDSTLIIQGKTYANIATFELDRDYIGIQ